MQTKKKEKKIKIWYKYSNNVFLYENDFQTLILLADMVFWMSDFDDFDNDQISWNAFKMILKIPNETFFHPPDITKTVKMSRGGAYLAERI